MARNFKRHGSAIRASFRDAEVTLLRSLRDQLRAALERGDPDDPVVQRLFPATVVGDDEADAELRRLLRDDLLRGRLEGLDELVGLLDAGTPTRSGLRIDLREEQPLLVLGVLNDLRLAIGASIGIEQLDRENLEPDEDLGYRLAVMDHLAWWQEQLLSIVDPPSVRHTDEPDPFETDSTDAEG
jgi:hypothetical protein